MSEITGVFRTANFRITSPNPEDENVNPSQCAAFFNMRPAAETVGTRRGSHVAQRQESATAVARRAAQQPPETTEAATTIREIAQKTGISGRRPKQEKEQRESKSVASYVSQSSSSSTSITRGKSAPALERQQQQQPIVSLSIPLSPADIASVAEQDVQITLQRIAEQQIPPVEIKKLAETGGAGVATTVAQAIVGEPVAHERLIKQQISRLRAPTNISSAVASFALGTTVAQLHPVAYQIRREVRANRGISTASMMRDAITQLVGSKSYISNRDLFEASGKYLDTESLLPTSARKTGNEAQFRLQYLNAHLVDIVERYHHQPDNLSPLVQQAWDWADTQAWQVSAFLSYTDDGSDVYISDGPALKRDTMMNTLVEYGRLKSVLWEMRKKTLPEYRQQFTVTPTGMIDWIKQDASISDQDQLRIYTLTSSTLEEPSSSILLGFATVKIVAPPNGSVDFVIVRLASYPVDVLGGRHYIRLSNNQWLQTALGSRNAYSDPETVETGKNFLLDMPQADFVAQTLFEDGDGAGGKKPTSSNSPFIRGSLAGAILAGAIAQCANLLDQYPGKTSNSALPTLSAILGEGTGDTITDIDIYVMLRFVLRFGYGQPTGALASSVVVTHNFPRWPSDSSTSLFPRESPFPDDKNQTFLHRYMPTLFESLVLVTQTWGHLMPAFRFANV